MMGPGVLFVPPKMAGVARKLPFSLQQRIALAILLISLVLWTSAKRLQTGWSMVRIRPGEPPLHSALAECPNCKGLAISSARDVGRLVARFFAHDDAALAAAASTLPGSDKLTVTLRLPHDGHFMRLDSIQIGNACRASTASNRRRVRSARGRRATSSVVEIPSHARIFVRRLQWKRFRSCMTQHFAPFPGS